MPTTPRRGRALNLAALEYIEVEIEKERAAIADRDDANARSRQAIRWLNQARRDILDEAEAS